MTKTTSVWVLAQWSIPSEFWEEEGERILDLLKYDTSFALGSLCSLDTGPKTIKTRVIKDGGEEVTVETATRVEEDSPAPSGFLSPDDYRARTGKRFRMTKEQKERGLSRDEAFREFALTLDQES